MTEKIISLSENTVTLSRTFLKEDLDLPFVWLQKCSDSESVKLSSVSVEERSHLLPNLAVGHKINGFTWGFIELYKTNCKILNSISKWRGRWCRKSYSVRIASRADGALAITGEIESCRIQSWWNEALDYIFFPDRGRFKPGKKARYILNSYVIGKCDSDCFACSFYLYLQRGLQLDTRVLKVSVACHKDKQVRRHDGSRMWIYLELIACPENEAMGRTVCLHLNLLLILVCRDLVTNNKVNLAIICLLICLETMFEVSAEACSLKCTLHCSEKLSLLFRRITFVLLPRCTCVNTNLPLLDLLWIRWKYLTWGLLCLHMRGAQHSNVTRL